MNSKKLVLTISVIGLVLSGLVGCAKGGGGGGGSANITGDASITGSTVSSAQAVNGQAMAVSISGLSIMNNYLNYGGTSGAGGTLNATILINGSSSSLQTYIVTPSTYNGAQSTIVGSNIVYSTAQCIDSTCQNVGLVVWIAPYSYYQTSVGTQMKQIGMIENLSNGTVRAATEQVGYPSNSGMTPALPTGPALISTMQTNMQ